MVRNAGDGCYSHHVFVVLPAIKWAGDPINPMGFDGFWASKNHVFEN